MQRGAGLHPLSLWTVRYQFTRWAIQLNEITPGLQQRLAPTDCRLRPDQHYTELGEYDKVRLGQTAASIASRAYACMPSLPCTATFTAAGLRRMS